MQQLVRINKKKQTSKSVYEDVGATLIITASNKQCYVIVVQNI